MAASIFCPHCHKHTEIRRGTGKTPNQVNYQAAARNGRGEVWWLGFCNACEGAVLVLDGENKIYPTPVPSPSAPEIPDQIRADLDEAKLCFSLGCFRAAATMARRSIQATCIGKGATASNLVQQTAELSANGTITKDIADWATLVRWIGNDAAHPGGVVVAKEDADDCLKLAEQFLHVVFVTPAIAMARRASRGK